MPVETAVLGYLLVTKQKRAEKRTETVEQHHIAEITAESTFIGQLLARVSALELLEGECIKRLLVLEGENARLTVQMEALKYELVERVAGVEAEQAKQHNGN